MVYPAKAMTSTNDNKRFQVAIDLPNNTFCGGTILNFNHVLTAASCAVNDTMHLVPADQVRIWSNILSLANTANQHAAAAIFVHPLFNPLTRENDIALIRVRLHFLMTVYEWIKLVKNTFAFQIQRNFGLDEGAPLQQRIVAEKSLCKISGWHITAGTVYGQRE